jgi:hypothetical protein
MTIRLTPGSEEEYKRYHSAVWPEVLSKILECNIRNYSIYFKDGVLFRYFEYHGGDLKDDWSKMAACQDSGAVGGDAADAGTPVDTKKGLAVGGDGRGLSSRSGTRGQFHTGE